MLNASHLYAGMKIGGLVGGTFGGLKVLNLFVPFNKRDHFANKVGNSILVMGPALIGAFCGASIGSLVGFTWPVSIPLIGIWGISEFVSKKEGM